jgi:hypothetical protein
MVECVGSGAWMTCRIFGVVIMGTGTGLKKEVTVGEALRVEAARRLVEALWTDFAVSVRVA